MKLAFWSHSSNSYLLFPLLEKRTDLCGVSGELVQPREKNYNENMLPIIGIFQGS